MRRIFFYTTLLFVLMAQYPQVSFAEKRNLIFTANNVDPTQNPRDKSQRTIMMMPNVAIDEYELFFSDSHPSYIIWKTKMEMSFLSRVFQNMFCNKKFLQI